MEELDQRRWNAELVPTLELIRDNVEVVVGLDGLSCWLSRVIPAMEQVRNSAIPVEGAWVLGISNPQFLRHVRNATALVDFRQLVANAVAVAHLLSPVESAMALAGTSSRGNNNAMSQKRYKKVTTVSKDLFGNKRIETKWVPVGGSFGTVALLIVLYLIFFRGCG